MLIKWTFVFGEKYFGVEVREEAEDVRISDSINHGKSILFFRGKKMDAYVNLKRCITILREEINEKTEEKTA